MKNLSERDREILSGTPLTGIAPPSPPRLDSRLASSRGTDGISSRSLVELIQQTQALVSHAGCDLYYRFDPNFSDLRSASAEVVQLTQLTYEPTEHGSFVLPARLDAAPAEVVETEATRRISAEDVLRRFSEIIQNASDPERAAQVSLGALRALEDLGTLLQREEAEIEYQPADTAGQLWRPARVDAPYLAAVKKVRATRLTTRTLVETLEGRITAIDLYQETFQFRLDGSTRRVKGTFSRLLHAKLVTALGRRVRLHGQVSRRGRTIVSIAAQQIDVVGDQ
jgi:hypothetical protein